MAAMPDFSVERHLPAPVAGVDEAGRGPLAGPVVAAAVVLEAARIAPGALARIDDSKKLSRAVREELFQVLCVSARIGIGAASVREIDTLNIHHAGLLAMERALAALDPPPKSAIVDGKFAPAAPCPVKTVVGGDGLCLSVAAASIIAKVVRDKIMGRLAVIYPGFGFDHNAGYGTAEHCRALERLGPTPHHRLSFARVLNFSIS